MTKKHNIDLNINQSIVMSSSLSRIIQTLPLQKDTIKKVQHQPKGYSSCLYLEELIFLILSLDLGHKIPSIVFTPNYFVW